MDTRRLANKSTATRLKSSRSTVGRAAVVLCQHVLLWTALYIAASTMYTLIMGVISVKDIPSVVLLLVSSIVSISYVILHTTTTRLNTSARNMMQCERADTLRSLARFTLRVLATLWLISAALSITATTSRQPLCVLSTTSAGTLDVMPLDKGVTCILNRTGILASFVALIVSGILVVLLDRVEGPFRCHLFGIVEEHRLLPLFLPHHKTAKFAMRSEVSFKCRSSTSVETEALTSRRSCSSPDTAMVPRKSSAKLLPPCPKNALGLGISTSKTSLPPSIVTPWPSTMTLRCHKVSNFVPRPPSSPLPPLPAYIPYRYQSPMTSQNTTYLPQRPSRLTRTRSFVTEPVTKPSRALMELHLAALNRKDSLSSVYSRSTSGGSLPALSESGGTLSPSGSTSVLGDIHLNNTTSAPGPNHSSSGFPSSWDVDNAAELEARISPVRLSTRAGVMKRHPRDTWVESPNLQIRAKSASPRKIRKTRESGREHSMF